MLQKATFTLLIVCSLFTFSLKSQSDPVVEKIIEIGTTDNQTMDHLDIHIEVVPVPFSELADMNAGEKSEIVRKRVMEARHIQEERYKEEENIHSNAQIPPRLLKINDKQKEYDERRTAKLNSLGLTVLRFSNESVTNHLDMVLFEIKESLSNINPLPLGGTGEG